MALKSHWKTDDHFYPTHWARGHWIGGEPGAPYYVAESQSLVAGSVVDQGLVAGPQLAEGFVAGAATQQGR